MAERIPEEEDVMAKPSFHINGGVAKAANMSMTSRTVMRTVGRPAPLWFNRR